MGRATRIDCELCGRAPGGVHADECPRSRVSQRSLRQEMASLGQGNVLWTFGVQSIQTSEGNKVVFNPGVPYVDQSTGRAWNAGGVPADMDAKIEVFNRAMQKVALVKGAV